MDIEEELGTLLFERRPRGVRLTSAGELFLDLARRQLSDTERMRSQIEELKGLRRGVVRIAGSQALAHSFLPASLALFRKQFPMLSFDVRILDHESAMSALAAYEVDLVLIFRPPFMPNFRPLMALEQRLVALLPAGHPLAKRKTVRLRDCATYPMALPGRAIGGRQLLEEVAARKGLKFQVVAESNSFEFLRSCVAGGLAISFQIEIGALPGPRRQCQNRRATDRRPRRAARRPGARPAQGAVAAGRGGQVRRAPGDAAARPARRGAAARNRPAGTGTPIRCRQLRPAPLPSTLNPCAPGTCRSPTAPPISSAGRRWRIFPWRRCSSSRAAR